MALNSRNTVVYHQGPGSPAAYAAIEQVITVSGPDGTAPTIDVTHLTSTAREYLADLPDPGTISMECNFTAGTKQMDLRTNFVNSADAEPFKIAIPTAAGASTYHTFFFNAIVSKWALSAGVGQQVKLTIDLKVTGAVSYAQV